MFTLRVIYDNSNEEIVQVQKVMVRPGITPGSQPAHVFWLDWRGDSQELDYGDLYVMNEQGKTVADYHLRPPKIAETGNQ